MVIITDCVQVSVTKVLGQAVYYGRRPASTRAQKNKKTNEKSIKMSCSTREQSSANQPGVKCGWEARYPRFKAKGIAD